jgi:hypothetical protein
VFQHVVRDEYYARIALAPLAAPDGPRLVTDLTCERVYFSAGQGLCLKPEFGVVTRYSAFLLGADFRPRQQIALDGNASRARISPDGRYGAVTTFVSGHSYADGNFSTQTLLIDMAGGAILSDLEQFTVLHDSNRLESVDFNFWGVTFARDSNRFYATLRTNGETYLVEGDVEARQVRTLHANVECPSLSPDNTRVAYKKRVSATGGWRLAVLDLATMTETLLAETRNIDDQVEWLDDGNILYATADADLWTVPANGQGSPRRFVSQGLSPAIVN